jgi:hypothetical protein
VIGRKLFGKLRREVLASARSVIRAGKRLETEMLV